MTTSRVFTVGHSNQPIDEFIELLQLHRVEAVVDIRSHPGSTWSPQFNRAPLRDRLKSDGIRYAFMGNQLGVRSKDPSHFQDGRISYGRLAESAEFQQGLSQVVRASAQQQVALMCSEQDPLTCHRSILIAPALEQAGIDVRHILRTGDLVPHDELLERLLKEEQLAQPDLFKPHDLRIREAMVKRESAIAWRDPVAAGSREAE